MNPKFNGWWENVVLTQDNKYDKGSPCWWAWEGWQGAQRYESRRAEDGKRMDEVSIIAEDAEERSLFDQNTAKLFGGDVLEHVQSSLRVLSKAAPQKGSYAKLLAICSNEIGKSRLTHKD